MYVHPSLLGERRNYVNTLMVMMGEDKCGKEAEKEGR
jgi:hypothetical protein